MFQELERSYTLSTPGGSSPVCCPPCSPPPAPAAYISSARASSRRLGAGSGGPPSPERDPLGRLLRSVHFLRSLSRAVSPNLMLDRRNVENVWPTSRVGGRVKSPEAIFRKRLPSAFSAFYVHRWDWIQVASMLLRARPTLVQLSFFYSRSYFTEVYKRVAQNERVNIRSKGGVNRVEIVLPLKFYPCSFPGQSSGSGKTPLLSFLGLRLRSSILTRANGTTNASFDAKLPLSTATASSPEGLSSQPDARSAMERR